MSAHVLRWKGKEVSGDAALSVHITWLTVVSFEILVNTFRARKSDPHICEFYHE